MPSVTRPARDGPVQPALQGVPDQQERTYAEDRTHAAPGVYDPPMYSQAVKVSDTQTILFIAGQRYFISTDLGSSVKG